MSHTLPALPILRLLMLSPARIAGTQILNGIFQGLADQGALEYRALFDAEAPPRAVRLAIAESDVILLFRSYQPDSLELLRFAKRNGKLVIYSTDDDLLAVDPTSPLGRMYHEPSNRSAYELLFREADLVWLFTEEMQRRYGPLNPSVAIGRLPCGVEGNHPPSGAFERAPGNAPCVIGYGSSTPYRPEWRFVVTPLLRVLDRYGPAVRVELINAPPEVCNDSRFTVVPRFSDLRAYYDYLRGPRWTIGLAPLEDTAFNRAKTNNKYREFAGLGIVGIYADLPVYADCVRHDETGFLTSYDEDEVYETVSRLVEQPALRARIARAALQDAASHYTLKAAQLDFLRVVSLLAIRKRYRGWKTPTLLLVGFDRAVSLHMHALQPCRELQQQDLLRFEWKQPEDLSPRCLDGMDAVYVVRAFQGETVGLLQWARWRGLPLISSWDDDFFSIPPGTSIGDYLHHPAVQHSMRRFLSESSLVVASTPQLAQRSRQFNSHVMEAAYGLDTSGLAEIAAEIPRPTDADDKIRIGFYGLNAAIAQPWVVEALHGLRARYGSRLVIELLGCTPPPGLRDLVDWFSDALPHTDSYRLLRARGWDIGLAPLEDTPFNAAKQATKFRDYAWAGVAMVCSQVPAYQRDLIDGIHCQFAENSAVAWEHAVSSLIDDRERIASLQRGAAQLLAAVHTQALTNATWYQVIWRIGVQRTHAAVDARASDGSDGGGRQWGSGRAAEAIEAYWEGSIHEAAHRDTLAALIARELPSRQLRVLEVGCGTGLIYARLVPEHLDREGYVGIDLSEQMLAIARRNYSGGVFLHGDGRALPFAAATFDLVLCVDVLGHLPDIAPLIRELLRVSKHTCLFTVWPSAGADIVDEGERIGGEDFLHRRYSDAYLRRVVVESAPDIADGLRTTVISAECWAYIVRKEARSANLPTQRIFPFPGYQTRAQQLAEQQMQSVEHERLRLHAQLDNALSQLANLKSARAEFDSHAISVTAELNAFRQRRITRWLNRLRAPGDLSRLIDPVFQSLNDESVRYGTDLNGFALGQSQNLQHVAFAAYPVEPRRRNLCGVLLAPILDFPMDDGRLGVEVVSPANEIVAHESVSLAAIDERMPTRITFPIIPDSNCGRFWLRVFVRDAVYPVRLYEWRRYRFGGLGRLQTRAFCCLLFEDTAS